MEPIQLDSGDVPGEVLDKMRSTGRRVEIADEAGEVLGVIMSPAAAAELDRLRDAEDYRLVRERIAAHDRGEIGHRYVLDSPEAITAFFASLEADAA